MGQRGRYMLLTSAMPVIIVTDIYIARNCLPRHLIWNTANSRLIGCVHRGCFGGGHHGSTMVRTIIRGEGSQDRRRSSKKAGGLTGLGLHRSDIFLGVHGVGIEHVRNVVCVMVRGLLITRHERANGITISIIIVGQLPVTSYARANVITKDVD